MSAQDSINTVLQISKVGTYNLVQSSHSTSLEHYHLNLTLSGIYILGLLIIFLVFFFKKNKGYISFVKYILFPLTFIGGLILYYTGYHAYEPHLNWFVKAGLALFSTARLFILGNDLIEVHNYIDTNFLIWFSVFSVSAVLISTSIIVNMVGKRFKSWVKILLNRSNENYIFMGVNNVGVILAKDIKKQNKNAFIVFVKDVFENEDDSLCHKINEIGGHVLNATSISSFLSLHHEELPFSPNEKLNSHLISIEKLDIKQWNLYRKIKKRASAFFILSDNEDQNIRLSQVVCEQIYKYGIDTEVKVHIRSFSKNYNDMYDDAIHTGFNTKMTIHYHNQSKIAASQLVKQHLPIKWLATNYPQSIGADATINRDFTIMFIGFGFTGSAVFRKFFEQCQFVGSTLKVIIVDKSIETCKGEFYHYYPSIPTLMKENLEFVEASVNTTKFYDLIHDKASIVDYVVISLGKDDLNIKVAHDIQRIILKLKLKFQIFANVAGNTFSHKQDEKQEQHVHIFGRDWDIFTEDVIVKGKMEQLAKEIHNYYNLRSGKSNNEWDQITSFTQESNISAVEHSMTKLLLADIVSFDSNLAEIDAVERIKQYHSYEDLETKIGYKTIENLGKTEHLRWNAFHFINGWTKWDIKDFPCDQTSPKDEFLKQHACLVDWNELDIVSKRFNQNFKQYDLDCLKDIYSNIHQGLYDKQD